jgi:hypothetical protein
LRTGTQKEIFGEGGGRLLEALNGSLTRIVDIKDQRELGDDKNVVDVLIDAAQLDLPALAGVRSLSRHEHPDGSAVQVRDIAEINDQLCIFPIHEPGDGLPHLVGFIASDKRSADFNQPDATVQCRSLDCHVTSGMFFGDGLTKCRQYNEVS